MDAAVLDDATGLRAWATVGRAPRGLVSEPGAIPGRLEVHLSGPAPRPLVFRVTVEPEGAARTSRAAVLRVAAGGDFGAASLSGVACGPATVVLTLVEGGAPGAVPPLRASVEVRSTDEFADPVLLVVASRDATTPGALLSGERSLRGIAGTVAGTVRVGRSGFRGFATTATDVLVRADDPWGVLGPLPPFVSIPAGSAEAPEPLRVTLRDAVGVATLWFRTGSAESSVVVESLRARWTAPSQVAVSEGEHVEVPLTLAPGTVVAPQTSTDVDQIVVRAAVRTADPGPYPERFVLAVDGISQGEATVRVSAPARPVAEIRVRVVPNSGGDRVPPR